MKLLTIPECLADGRGPSIQMMDWVAGQIVSAGSELLIADAVEEIAEGNAFWSMFGDPSATHMTVETMAPLSVKWADVSMLEGALLEMLYADKAHASLGIDTMPTDPPQLPGDPLAFVFDADVHPTVARAVLSGIRAYIALAGILGSNGGPSIEWRRLIAAYWMRNLHAYLRLLASLDGTAVPYDIVPASERFDIAGMDAETANMNATYRRWLDAAAQSGQRAYSPFDGWPHT